MAGLAVGKRGVPLFSDDGKRLQVSRSLEFSGTGAECGMVVLWTRRRQEAKRLRG